MVYTLFKPILEVRLGNSRNLEAEIKKDFGEAGFAKFKEHNVQVNIIPDDYFFVDLSTKDMREGPQKAVTGRVYHIHVLQGVGGMEVYNVRADNANVMLRPAGGAPYLLTLMELTFDLNPQNEAARYLRMVFDVSPDNTEIEDDSEVGF